MRIVVDTVGPDEIELPDYLGPQDIHFFVRREFGITEANTLHEWHIVEEDDEEDTEGSADE